MLTQEQIDKLQPLCQNERYGKILQDAIETWKNSQPCQKTFGVYVPNDNNSVFIMGDNKRCCLIGAAGYTKTPFLHSLLKTIVKEYALTDQEEVWAISDGFDGKNSENFKYVDAYMFGKQIADIIQPICV